MLTHLLSLSTRLFMRKHNRLISPYNKKRALFLKKFVVLSCVFAFFVVPLHTNLCNYAIL